jgi:hypothetical protein
MRTVVKILSVFGMVIQSLLFLACLTSSGLSDAPPESNAALIPILMPFLYFAFCFFTSLRNFKVSVLLPTGIVAHLIIVPFYCRAIRDGVGLLVIMPLVLSACWLLMCFQREELPK